MIKRSILLGAASGILAGIASVVYQKVYTVSLGADFANIAKPINIMLISVVSTIVASAGYWLAERWLKSKGDIVFNLVFIVLSFASILSAFAVRLPIDVETPELFPGLMVPMHFFPALAWFTLKPLFINTHNTYRKVFA